jgi:hypothetical protein
VPTPPVEFNFGNQTLRIKVSRPAALFGSPSAAALNLKSNKNGAGEKSLVGKPTPAAG